MFKYLVFLVLAVSAPALAAQSTPTVPKRFQGEWNERVNDCGTGDNDSAMRLTATRLELYESSGPIRAVVTNGEFELMVIAELSGEGESHFLYRRYRLAGDGSYLADVTDGDKYIRYRCPAKR